ncbi:MAG: DUF6677 family protein [bacterium]|nr:hypothetical protein [Candidatus Sumerlaeota bacterium]
MGRNNKYFVLVMSWLVPGFGFAWHGLWWRALFFFVVLEAAFLAGAFLQGSVLVPEFAYTNKDFNLVTILTFFTQMFNGLLGIVSVAPDLLARAGIHVRILPYNETNQWFDLGSFYLLVSGGMNYFVMMSTCDHFYGRKAGMKPEYAAHGAQKQ